MAITMAQYLEEAGRTAHKPMVHRVRKDDTVEVDRERMVHAALGLCTESGEFADIIKGERYYKKKMSREHVVEELGDILWYMGEACRTVGVSFEEVAEINLRKLKARYPQDFTAARAVNRNVAAEQAAMKKVGDASDGK